MPQPRRRGGPNKWNRARRLGKAPARSRAMRGRFKTRPRTTRNAPLVNRQFEATALTAWPLTADMVPTLQPMFFESPTSSHSYRRGLDIGECSGNALVSRNITCHLTVQMPKAGVANQTYQFRIVTGFNRMPVSGNIQASTYPSAIDGITTAWLNTIPGARAKELFTDAVGQEAGVMNPRGNIAQNYITVLSDRTHSLSSISGDPGNLRFNDLSLNYNLKVNKKVRLYPATTSEAVTPWDEFSMAAINNPNLGTPFVAVILMNFDQYQSAADAPHVKFDWTHYWNNA